MIEKILEEIGLTNSEIKVYLALLELGTSTRSEIVHKSGIAGSKVYDILEKLKDKGLVSVYSENKIKTFKALNPKQIMYYLEEKKQNITNIETETKNILPQLLAKFNLSSQEQEVELLTGIKGLEIFFREQVDVLKKGDVNYVIGGTKGTSEEAVTAFFRKIHIMREQKKIKTKMLYNKRQRKDVEKYYATKEYPNTETRFISHNSPVSINIYKDRTLITVFENKIFAIHIKSQDVANSFMEYFDLLWAQSEK